MKTILRSVLLLVASLCSSQSKQVTIIGHMPQEFGSEYVSFSKPIGKFALTFDYINSADNAELKKDKFIKTLNLLAPGLIALHEKPFNGTISARFFAEPGDTVYIERQNGEIIFKGKNATMNKMYNGNEFGQVAFYDETYEVLKNTNKAHEIIKKLTTIKTKYYNIYNALFLKKEISKSCLEYTKIVMDHCIDDSAFSVVFYDDIREELKITKEEANKLKDYLNSKYRPYKEENLWSPYFLGYIRMTAKYMKEQALKQNKNIDRFWNQFDNLFSSQMKEFGVIDYAEFDDYKEAYIGGFLVGLTTNNETVKSFKYKDLITVYKAFVEKFPNSPYVVPLSTSIMNIGLNSSNTVASNTVESAPKIQVAIGNLGLYDTTLESVGNKNFATSNQSLVAALEEKFPNQNFFIDFWATWCSPCIMQFPYNKELDSFLDTQNIKTLYVSFDREEDINKWEKYIKDYNLKGYHFLANKAYKEKFLNTLSESIPRYLLYNCKTKTLKPLEGFPKDKENFYANITKTLLAK
jgi:thiol-disulfide isomerase/thioredoxin